MTARSQRRGLLFWLAVLVPVFLLAVTIIAVWQDWQGGAGEIGLHGFIALAGAGFFSVGLTLLLVWLMIRSHRRGTDDQTGLPDDARDRDIRGGPE